MRKPLPNFLLGIFLLISQVAFTQSTANYARTSNATASLENMAGSTRLIAGSVNNSASEVYGIGFDFWFMGVRYNMFSANSNGAIRLGTTAISGSSIGNSFPIASQQIIAPFMGDLATHSSGKVHFKNDGYFPNRRLIVEWLNMEANYNSTSADCTFQLILSEITGQITFTYGSMSIGNGNLVTADRRVVIGFCNTNTANNVMTVSHSSPFITNTAAAPTVVDYATTGAIAGLTSASQGTRKQIIFTPPTPLAPLSPNATGVGSNTTTINWTDIAGELGYVVYMSDDGGSTYEFMRQVPANTVTSVITPLLSSKAYRYKVYSVSEGRLTEAALVVNATTGSCGAAVTKTASLTGTTGVNWSAITWTPAGTPGPCDDVVLTYSDNGTGSYSQSMTVTMDVDISIRSLTLRNISPLPNYKKVFSVNGNIRLEIANDLTMVAPGGHRYNRAVLANTKETIINGNLTLGSTTPIATEGHGAIGSTGTLPEQNYLMRGNMTFNKRGYTTDEHCNFIFAKNGTQYLYNNIPWGPTDDTSWAVLFERIVIGDGTNATELVFGGTGGQDGYVELANRGGVVIERNSRLTLPQNYTLNATGGLNYFIMKQNAQLWCGGNSSIVDPYSGMTYGAPGSNFPASFTEYVFDPTSTVNYYGSNAITQTVYNVPVYQNLRLTNGSASGLAHKNNTSNVTVAVDFKTEANTRFTLGANLTGNCPMNIQSTGQLYCGTNTVLGTGTFDLNAGATIGMGSPQGITTVGTASGNVQNSGATRAFNTTANYVYNGSAAQVTGNGLPSTCNDLIADNPTTVTIAANQTVNGNNGLYQGVFDIGLTQITINGAAGVISSTGGKMKANLGLVNMQGTGGTQNLNGGWFVNKTISTLIDANSTGITVAPAPNDTLVIASALLYGASTTNSAINTGNNMVLLSRDTATARFGSMLNGNSITGSATVERYVGTLRKWRHLAWNTTSTQTAKQTWMENSVAVNDNIKPRFGCIVTDEQNTWSANGFDSKSVSGPSVKYHNPVTNTFTGIPNTHTYAMNTHNAYYNFVRGDRTCTPANALTSNTILRSTGTLKTGTVNFPIGASQFTDVGNPYASPVRFSQLTRTNIQDFFYVWDPKLTGAFGLGAYQTIFLSGGQWRIMPGGGSYGVLNTITDTLESGQAFFVRATGSAGNVRFTESTKTMEERTMSRGGGMEESFFAILSYLPTGGKELVDGTGALFGTNYGNGVDYNDALKMANTSENLSLKRNGELLAIEKRNHVRADDSLFLNLAGVRLGNYVFDFKSIDMDVPGRTAFLVDKYLQTTTPISLTQDDAYNFTIINVTGSWAPDRFVIVFKQTASALPIKFIDIKAQRMQNKQVRVEWNVSNEIYIDRYKIERSFNNEDFSEIGQMTPGRNNGTDAAYAFDDVQPTDGEIWYRITAVDYQGALLRSRTARVAPVNKDVLLGIYPNPVRDGIVRLRLSNQALGNYTIVIYNAEGQLIKQSKLNLQSDNMIHEIPLKAATGNYKAVVTSENGQKTTISFMLAN